ncbi:hypothetical protein HZU40_23695 [Mycolicibacterium fluoranthenivorans]|uniref:GPI inositol-deacylase PGAP1-like alpha/beta domain-containing protein n=1 Tax=Mycolicibacterium fluoranthenivorans TaxID=258505 RepID=A0A7G8PA34_9MYCO|nr:VCBS domain-containing protein [Mycolicibacterium fluoranthenivorans]QNJ91200.1 hypothetical protein HZU40_23695 [Mycolicibacterium fluoranthenivorans]
MKTASQPKPSITNVKPSVTAPVSSLSTDVVTPEPAPEVKASAGTASRDAVVAPLLSPLVAPGTDVPVQSPAEWVLLAAARRQIGSDTGEQSTVAAALSTSQPLATATGSGAVPNSAPTATVTVGKPSITTGVVTGTVKGVDVDKDVLTYSTPATTAKGGTVQITATNGKFTYTPSVNARQTAATSLDPADKQDSFVVTVTDAFGATGTVTVQVAIDPNNIPVAGAHVVNAPNDTTGAVTGTVKVTDLDKDKLTYTTVATTAKGKITLNASTGAFTYTPTQAAREAAASTAVAAKQDSFIVTIKDAQGASITTPVTVYVSPNKAPTIPTITGISTNPTTGVVTGTVTATDPDAEPGAVVKYTVGATATKSKVSIDAKTGAFTYTPTAAARHAATLKVSPVTSDTFTVSVTDAKGAITTKTVTLEILPSVNTTPAAKVPTPKTNATTGLVTGTIAGSDKDKDTLTYRVSTNAANGSVTIDGKGKFVYAATSQARHSAAANDAVAKSDSFTITVNDGHGGLVDVPVNVEISPQNTAPANITSTVGQPSSSTGVVNGSIVATDSDHDALSFTAPAGTKKGAIVIRPDGTFSYTPTATALATARALGASSAAKTDKFTVKVDDGHGGVASVAVSLAFVNAAPVGGVPSIGTPDGRTGAVSTRVSFSDPDGDKLTYGTAGIPPTRGTIVMKADGTFTYTPTATARLAAGIASTAVTDTFAVTATDSHGAVTSVNVVVPVDPARHIVTGSIAVGSAPSAVIVSHDGSRAYVTNYADGTLSVLNTATNVAVGTPIKLGVLPGALSTSADGTRIYVVGIDAATNAGKLVVVNAATNKVVGPPVAVGVYPTGIAVSPDGARAYVTNGGDNTLTVVDVANNVTVGTPIAVGLSPTSVAITPDGTRAYITNGGSNTVTVINAATGAVIGTPILVGGLPIGIAVAPNGTRAYVANANAGTVSVINTASNTVVGSPISVGPNPQAIAVSPDGARIYVVGTDGALTVINAATNTVMGGPLSLGGRSSGVAVNADGTRIYAITAANALTVVSLSSTKNAPTAPVAPGAATTNANGSVVGTLGISDPTAVTYSVTMRPTLGTVTVKADGSYIYTPTAAARQYASTAPVTDTFTINATNTRGASTPLTITLTVAPASVTVVAPEFADPIVAYHTEYEIDQPRMFLALPNGLRAYTINGVQTAYNTRESDTISVIDTVANVVLGEPIRVDDSIADAALTPNGRYLYVVRAYAESVRVFDTSLNNSVVAEIPVGAGPSEIIASPDGKRMYVLNGGDGFSAPTISVIDTASKAVVGNAIGLNVSPTKLVVSNDSSRLYVLGDDIDVIDTNTRSVIRNIAVGQYFVQDALSPNGRTLYLTTFDGTKVLAVDTATGAVSTRVTNTDYYFQDLAISPDGTRLYTTTLDRVLGVFDAQTGAVIAKTKFDGQPLSIAVSPDGTRVYALTYYVGVQGTGTRLLTLDTTRNTFIGTPLVLSRSVWHTMNISADGSRVYVPASVDGGTYVVDTGRAVQTVSTPTAQDLYTRLRQLTDYPWSKDGLAIEQVQDSAGTKRVIVYFGGTVFDTGDNTTATREALRNLPLYFDNFVDHTITNRIDDVLKDLPASTEIMFVGYSMGGMDAQNIAAAWISEHHKGTVTTVLTFASPIVQSPGPSAKHVVHMRANFDPVPLLGIAGFGRFEADWLGNGQIFAVNANVPPTLDLGHLHGDPRTYIDVGRQFDDAVATRYPMIKADLARFAGTVIEHRLY